MANQNSIKNLSSVPQPPKFTVNLTGPEIDTLNLNIPRSRALADIMQVADQTGDAEPYSIGECIPILFELLSGIDKIWEGAKSRKRKEETA